MIIAKIKTNISQGRAKLDPFVYMLKVLRIVSCEMKPSIRITSLACLEQLFAIEHSVDMTPSSKQWF